MTHYNIAAALTAFSLLTVPAMAQDMGKMDHSKMDHSRHDQVQTENAETATETIEASGATVITAEVNGLVCDFCAQSLRKVFKKQDAVEGIKVDLDNGEVNITLKPDANMDDATVGKLIRKSGYSLVGIERAGGA